MRIVRPTPCKVVVAGTGFGRIYLDAIGLAPKQYRLAGILARGSNHSMRCAREHGVPLFTDIGDIPEDVEIVCVVLRSGSIGSPGTELTKRLLARGFHVLQEHPVHAAEITECLRLSRANDTAYAINTLYPNLEPVRQFLAAAEQLRRRRRILCVDAACNSQVSYPLLDLLGHALGGLRPWSFNSCPPPPGQPFSNLYATIAGVPTTLHVHNQVHPEDPDNHGLLMHRISLFCDGGVLTLSDTHGPVLWNARMHSPRDANGRLQLSGPGTERLACRSTSLLDSAPPPSFHDIFARIWPTAMIRALDALRADIADPQRRVHTGRWALDVSLAWHELSGQLGTPELIRPVSPEPLPLEKLVRRKGRKRPAGCGQKKLEK
ncbi:Gfo/Idh/MocA family oxidoreductase [Marichromatium bheemlicum]|uniref:Gfo/Idh/MocA family oxidoreductase n=1 Tax=Marichromatium bheemlicum TaxID=365339 RepID=A0ABX1I6U6_9GAMM|nr:Gfo/Idh/MocA family oxidoreductase [Marichromatium bheemlicum]NKN33292.1 Gfo/Idh/MocA family oxidoreductase [Marichromatium bheemlicum]